MKHFALNGQSRQVGNKAVIKAFRKQGLVPCNLYGCGVENELQFHPVKDNCLHIDFLAVDEKKPIAISVPIKFEGHAIGVQKGGKFVPGARSLRISAKMENLPDDITINISKLDLDKKIKAGDVKLENVSVLTDKDAILCFVKTTRNVDASAAAASEE